MSKDMLTVPRDLLQDLIDDVADYAVSRTFKDRETTWRSDLLDRARALLARQPAAIDRQGAAIRDRARRFLSEFVRQTGISMSDHVQEVMLNLFLRYAAPLANEASKPAPSVEQEEQSSHAPAGEVQANLDRDALKTWWTGRDAEFKNFHRALCERFDYIHDEKDWKRDQVSLIEWIAKRLAPAAPSVEQDERGACVHADEPKECYRVRCQLGNKCVDDDMSPRAASTSANVAQGADDDARAAVEFYAANPSAALLDFQKRFNVAQGSEAVSDEHAAVLWRLARMTDAIAWTAELRKAIAPPAQHKSDWHPDFVTALYDNADPDKRYTMDQMREYADAFHRSRIDATQPAQTALTDVAQGAETVAEDISLVRELQKALFYWMPRIAGEDSPAGHKAAEHAYLLIGLDDNSPECYGDQARSSLGIVNRELERIGIACSDAGCPDEMEVADFIADLYARAQAAATVASTDDARECLADVVSHYRALYAGLAFQLNEATVSENSDDMTYWKHEIKALERMYEQAERALTAAQPACGGDTRPLSS
jgi:hypothetical protein